MELTMSLFFHPPPYTAYERQTNKNHNRILCRFFPKSCDFSKLTAEEVICAEHWMTASQDEFMMGKPPP